MNIYHEELQPPDVSRNQLDFSSLAPGDNSILQELISNPSNRPLLWHTDGKSWLNLDKCTGILQPGQQEIVHVMVDTSSLAVGNHTATLIFSAEDDASSKSIEVAVTLAVSAPPFSAKKGQSNE